MFGDIEELLQQRCRVMSSDIFRQYLSTQLWFIVISVNHVGHVSAVGMAEPQTTAGMDGHPLFQVVDLSLKDIEEKVLVRVFNYCC